HSRGYNWIQHYTDAKYSVWEAEGNPNYDANLEYDNNIMEEINSGDTLKYLSLIPSAANSAGIELINGPYYVQEVKYYVSQYDNLDIIKYRADFRLMLKTYPFYPLIEDNQEDTFCVIQVSQSKVSTTGGWHLSCTDVIKERVLKRSVFPHLNNFYDFSFDNNPILADYTLDNNSCDSIDIYPHPVPVFHSYQGTDSIVPGPRWGREYIQFKVIWKGNQK